MKKTILIGLSLFSLYVFTHSPPVLAEDVARANSKVTAEVVSGGYSLTATDVDFGRVEIGSVIPTQPITVTLSDLTGGDGWVLTSQNDSYHETSETLLLNFEGEILTNNSSVIAYGESTSEEQVDTGQLGVTWGTHPKAGQFIANLTWVLGPDLSHLK